MSTSSLAAGSWPIIRWSAVDIQRIELVHLESLATHQRDAARPAVRCGSSCWGAHTVLGMLGVSWQWSEVAPQVFALTDPMAIESNLALLASDGSCLSPLATALVLNRIVATLHWQVEAARACRRHGGPRVDAAAKTATARSMS